MYKYRESQHLHTALHAHFPKYVTVLALSCWSSFSCLCLWLNPDPDRPIRAGQNIRDTFKFCIRWVKLTHNQTVHNTSAITFYT